MPAVKRAVNQLSGKNRARLAGLVLFAITTAIYLPILHADFVWDDYQALHENVFLRIPGGLWKIWSTHGQIPNETHYWPIIYTAYWIEYRLWGFNPLGYHVVNVLVHALNTLLIWALLRRMRLPGAWLAAALFGLHPVHVESVAWIHEFKDVSSAFFYLAAFHCVLSYEARRRPWLLAAIALLFIAGMFCKTVVVTLPIALAIWVWYRDGRIGGPALRPIGLLLLLAVALGFFDVAMTHCVEHFEADLSLLQRVLLAGRAFIFYLGKLIVPIHLTTVYPKWTLNPAAARLYFFPIASIGGIVTLWLLRPRIGRAPLAAILFFAVTIGPMLGLVPFSFMRIAYVADRFHYLASIGPLVLIAALTVQYAERYGRKWLKPTVVGLLLLPLAGLTWAHAALYEDLETLFRQAMAYNPDSVVVHNNLGAALEKKGRIAEAQAHFKEALRIRPDYPEANNNLGLILARQGDLKGAIGHYRMVLRDGRFWVQTANDLAWFLATAPDAKLRDPAEALQLATRAADLSGRRNPAILDTLAASLAASGRFDEAADICQKALLLARMTRQNSLAAQLEERLICYRLHQPYIDTPQSSR